MQDDGQDSGRSSASGRPDESRATSASEWADIARRIERQVRRDAARLIGAGEVDDWGAIKDALAGRVKGQAEALDRIELGRRVEQIGKQIEEQARSGLAEASGLGHDADWSAIGRGLRERLEQALDPEGRRVPGGSGTGASAEDASVPAAPPTPDRPPTPAPAGGEDTGLPTVTDDVDEVERPPNDGRPPTVR